MPIAPLRHALRMGVWWLSCRLWDIRALRVPCAPADGIACLCRLTSATGFCIPCADELMARGSM